MSAQLPKVRRVVTGHDGESKAVAIFDSAPPNTRNKFSQKDLGS
jgi:hypothetical protein